MFRRSLGVVAAIGLLAVAACDAVSADDLGGAYVGGNFGRARNTYGPGFIDGQISTEATSAGDTVSYTAKSVQRMSDGWWIDTGYLFTPYVGIEAAFLHLGEIRYIAVGTLGDSAGSRFLSTTTEVTSHGPALAAILRLPLTEAVELDLRLGDYLGKATSETNVTVASASSFTAQSKSTSSLLAGIGGSYTIAGHWSMRLDYVRINDTGDKATVGKFSVNLATAGISYTF
jgi:opacity protein-like surface antigen